MAKKAFILLLLFILASILLPSLSASEKDRKVYIVYMGNRHMDEISTSSLHTSLLQEAVGSTVGPESLLYSYRRSFSGFAAQLTEQEAQKMAGMEGVVSVFPSEKRELHTTRSWEFVGFPQQVQRTTVESDIIIGVLDSGIWPESDSFSDNGFGPPPKRWKGTCKASADFTCNNKIIGAQYYRSSRGFDPRDILSPRDSDGHGTHVASTVAGNGVSMASVEGLGLGTARGGVPSARIAVYKVCWSDGCDNADILAAFDDAIADGVDILSISVGGAGGDYFRDAIAIGSFLATRNGILTSNSAGNDGPTRGSISNFSPWSLSVAASTTDRKFITEVQLGNKKTYKGISINTFDLKNKGYPIIYGGDAADNTSDDPESSASHCDPDMLDWNLVKGKIVLCDGPTFSEGAFQAGAVGAVIRGAPIGGASSFPLSASYLSLADGSKIYLYINSTRNPTATIRKTEEAKDAYAPYIPDFSSRGPSPITPNILKPDLAAPGVNILAAWSPISPISEVDGDERVFSFNIMSGTSMASPHAAAVAAYVKSFHPTWSPAAIKSALMTTAIPMSSGKNPDAEYAYGSGNISPLKAPHPGLVYDIEALDYVKFLCAEGYNTKLLRALTRDDSTCSKVAGEKAFDPDYPYIELSTSPSKSTRKVFSRPICRWTTLILKPRDDSICFGETAFELNYPSLALSTSPLKPISKVFHRTVTNVGSPISTYRAIVNAPSELSIKVNPNVLSFTSLEQKLSFMVKIEGTIDRSIVSASLVWNDGTFQVRSPIVVSVA